MTADLKVMLKNAMDEDKSLGGKIIKELNIAQSTLSKFVNNPDRGNDLRVALKVISYIWPDREYELMTNYIKTLNPKKDITRQALEYANVNKLNDLFLEVLHSLERHGSKENKEWVEVYKIDWQAMNGEITPFEAIDKLNKLDTETDEMKVYCQIAKFYCYDDKRMIPIMIQTSQFVEHLLGNLEEGYIKQSYIGHFNIIMANVYLHNGEINTLRNKVYDSLEKVYSQNLLARLHHAIGKSYFFESYDKALGHFNNAINLSLENKVTTNEVNKSINFLNSYWKNGKPFIEVNNDQESIKADMGFNKLTGSLELGLEMLNTVDYNAFSDVGKGYYFFYLGRATNNKDYYYESLKYYLNSGERFYKRMSLIELERLGIDKGALMAFSF